MAAADVALHLAKRNGRNQIHVFSADNDQRARMDMELGWSSRLEAALKHNGFMLCYQPILPLARSNTIICRSQQGALWTRHLRRHGPAQRDFHETLIRLRAADGTLVAPNAFLPAAERFSLIADIDRWVIRHAFQVLRDAEHVDRPEILRALHACGVERAQGFYIGRPRPSLRAANRQLELVHDIEPPDAVAQG